MRKMMRINVGCGKTPTKGWDNYDNASSLRLEKTPFIPDLLMRLRLIGSSRAQFIRFARENKIRYGDVTKGLPIKDNSVSVLYSCHMLEHLDRSEVAIFLREAIRVLCPCGVIRIAVPDIKKLVNQYMESGDADEFIGATLLASPQQKSFAKRLRMFLSGHRDYRQHQWMYDGASLASLLKRQGFVNIEVLPAGQTRIESPDLLDLYERDWESVYVEAVKPNG